MQIQLNTDNNIDGKDSLAAWVDSEITDKLSRFGDHITRVEVHLSDTNAARDRPADKRCTLEARLAGRAPVAVSGDASTVAEALHAAIAKLTRALDTTLGKLEGANRRDSVRGDAGS